VEDLRGADCPQPAVRARLAGTESPSPLLAEIKEPKSSHLNKFKAEKKQIVAARTANAEMLCAHL
jgi:TusA-related sulfurtransferase